MSDWDTVVLRKRQPKASAMKTECAINQARRKGFAIETSRKFNAATNCQHAAPQNTTKLDRETDELRHKKIPVEVGKLIQQGRNAKGLTQKDLATKICEKPQVVNDYEAGRGIPNNVILGKMERVIGMKLRGSDIGKPLLLPPSAKK